MPTYAYACTSCDHRFEVQQSFSDSTLTDCPECEGRIRKLFNSVGIVFKGSGFYRTDSRGSVDGNGSSSENKSTDSSEKSGSASETKAPEKKPDGEKTAAAAGSSGGDNGKSSSSSAA